MTEEQKTGQIAIFTNAAGDIKVDVKLEKESLWLTQEQISVLFGKERSVITKHINNILKQEELDDSVCAKFAHTGSDGKLYQVGYYNLDMIISVGYRVNSKRGVEFRRWANGVLKDYLLKGYSINQESLNASKVKELQQTIELLSNTLINQDLIKTEGEEILAIIRDYAKTWDILIKYDEDRLLIPDYKQSEVQVAELSYEMAVLAIKSIRQDLKEKGESVGLFGNEKDNSLKGILGNIYQTFGGVDLYPTIEEKAAHLIYFIIKNHPFSDGNKRIGCFLFLLFMQKNKALLPNTPSPEGLTAMALLIAESDPAQKELIIKLVVNLINGK